MRAAACPAVAGAETGHDDLAGCAFVYFALRCREGQNPGHARTRLRQQIINMPMQPFSAAEMPRNASRQMAFGAAGIDVAALGKRYDTEFPHVTANGVLQCDGELISTVRSCGLRCRRSGELRGRLGYHAAVVQKPEITSPAMKGLDSRSSPKVESGPWPGMKVTSSPSGQSCSVIQRIDPKRYCKTGFR